VEALAEAKELLVSPNRAAACLAGALVTALLATSTSATTIAYWRMEADLDPSANGLRIANEIAGASALTSSEAFVDLAANPNGTVPFTGSTNLGSVGATLQGGANGINATAAWWPALDVSSITLEFWARTGEGTATLFRRSSGANGIVLNNPNALALVYYVSNGSGGGTRVALSGLDNMSSTWRHYAFTYDAPTGVGTFYVDGVAVRSNDGPDGRALYWGSSSSIQIGWQMDYAAAFNGTMDEVRLSDLALPPTMFLATVPEPGTAAPLLAGLLLIGAWRRRA
jgi:hypothetical protein